MKPKPVLIDWMDASHFDEGWQLKSSINLDGGDGYTYSIGWLIKQDRKWYYLADTNADGCVYLAGKKIPRKMVNKIIDLTEFLKSQGLKW